MGISTARLAPLWERALPKALAALTLLPVGLVSAPEAGAAGYQEALAPPASPRTRFRRRAGKLPESSPTLLVHMYHEVTQPYGLL
jgi:hypothetical protein